MLDQRRRRWASIDPTLGERLVFAGMLVATDLTGGGGATMRLTPS